MVESAKIEYQAENIIPDLSNAMSKGEFLHFMKLHKDIEEQLEIVKERRKALRHYMERQGIELQLFDQVRKDMGIAVEVLRERQKTLELYRNYASLPVGTQGEMFGISEESPGDTMDATEQGYIAAMTGNGATSDENPFEAGSKEGGQWHDGWLRGQEELARHLKKSGAELGW